MLAKFFIKLIGLLSKRYSDKKSRIKSLIEKAKMQIETKNGMNKYFHISRMFVLIIFSTLRSFVFELIFITFLISSIIYFSVTIFSCKYIYTDIDKIPYNKVALVLGTSKYLSDGRENMYFYYRMQAAATLYKSGRVQYLLVSGDNRHHSYNEPKAMKADLTKLGVPDEAIVLDFAGFRTHDSILRAKAVFGQTNFTIVSQGFHNERAVFISRSKGMSTVAYNAKNVRILYRLRQTPRETLSRVLMFFDIIIDRQPYFYGEPITIGVDASES